MTTALVTGGTSGIGAAFARATAKERGVPIGVMENGDGSFVPHGVWPTDPEVAAATPVLVGSSALPPSALSTTILLLEATVSLPRPVSRAKALRTQVVRAAGVSLSAGDEGLLDLTTVLRERYGTVVGTVYSSRQMKLARLP